MKAEPRMTVSTADTKCHHLRQTWVNKADVVRHWRHYDVKQKTGGPELMAMRVGEGNGQLSFNLQSDKSVHTRPSRSKMGKLAYSAGLLLALFGVATANQGKNLHFSLTPLRKLDWINISVFENFRCALGARSMHADALWLHGPDCGTPGSCGLIMAEESLQSTSCHVQCMQQRNVEFTLQINKRYIS